MKFRFKKAQSIAEYAIVFGVVIAAATGISAIIKEGIQDRVASEARKIGDDSPGGNASFDITQTTNSQRNESQSLDVAAGGAVTDTQTIDVTSSSSENYSAGN
jgi:hypothetical protein